MRIEIKFTNGETKIFKCNGFKVTREKIQCLSFTQTNVQFDWSEILEININETSV